MGFIDISILRMFIGGWIISFLFLGIANICSIISLSTFLDQAKSPKWVVYLLTLGLGVIYLQHQINKSCPVNCKSQGKLSIKGQRVFAVILLIFVSTILYSTRNRSIEKLDELSKSTHEFDNAMSKITFKNRIEFRLANSSAFPGSVEMKNERGEKLYISQEVLAGNGDIGLIDVVKGDVEKLPAIHFVFEDAAISRFRNIKAGNKLVLLSNGKILFSSAFSGDNFIDALSLPLKSLEKVNELYLQITGNSIVPYRENVVSVSAQPAAAPDASRR